MRHIKKFENFSINELQDWTTMPVDVNKGLGDMMNKFYSEFPELVAEVKQNLGNKFTAFKQNLEELVAKISNLDKSTLDKLGEDVKSFFGVNVDKKQMRAKVEDLVNQELRKEGLITENRYSKYNSNRMYEWNLFGKPKLTPAEYRLQKELGILDDEDEKKFGVEKPVAKTITTKIDVSKPKIKNVLKNVIENIFSAIFSGTFASISFVILPTIVEIVGIIFSIVNYGHGSVTDWKFGIAVAALTMVVQMMSALLWYTFGKGLGYLETGRDLSLYTTKPGYRKK